MNKYLHYCAPILLGTLFGFGLGYGYRCREVGNLKRLNNELANGSGSGQTTGQIQQTEQVQQTDQVQQTN